ncbi:hypothetical protein Plo01_52020 [Planobispora longispora]|uniref:Uncharacterized protein n=1 Tax=Planobispora longispora TaxID=28887 RepID=A0A8J3RPK0_9ACTN|nr:hypothetical protein Plo01_52020 [Planobispora longispora]
MSALIFAGAGSMKVTAQPPARAGAERASSGMTTARINRIRLMPTDTPPGLPGFPADTPARGGDRVREDRRPETNKPRDNQYKDGQNHPS